MTAQAPEPSARRLSRRLRLFRLEREIALRLGFSNFSDYFADRRGKGWGYTRIARETGQNRDWVRSARERHERVAVASGGPAPQHPITTPLPSGQPHEVFRRPDG